MPGISLLFWLAALVLIIMIELARKRKPDDAFESWRSAFDASLEIQNIKADAIKEINALNPEQHNEHDRNTYTDTVNNEFFNMFYVYKNLERNSKEATDQADHIKRQFGAFLNGTTVDKVLEIVASLDQPKTARGLTENRKTNR